MKKDITELYCCIEDFCSTVDENFANMLLPNGRKPTRIAEITTPEILTIILLYPMQKFQSFLPTLSATLQIRISQIANI